jgi:hypothetical protein
MWRQRWQEKAIKREFTWGSWIERLPGIQRSWKLQGLALIPHSFCWMGSGGYVGSPRHWRIFSFFFLASIPHPPALLWSRGQPESEGGWDLSFCLHLPPCLERGHLRASLKSKFRLTQRAWMKDSVWHSPLISKNLLPLVLCLSFLYFLDCSKICI